MNQLIFVLVALVGVALGVTITLLLSIKSVLNNVLFELYMALREILFNIENRH